MDLPPKSVGGSSEASAAGGAANGADVAFATGDGDSTLTGVGAGAAGGGAVGAGGDPGVMVLGAVAFVLVQPESALELVAASAAVGGVGLACTGFWLG